MAATVKRNEKGEITHILVGMDMMPKEDANKVLYGDITAEQIQTYLLKNKKSLFPLVADILNERETIIELKKHILGFKK